MRDYSTSKIKRRRKWKSYLHWHRRNIQTWKDWTDCWAVWTWWGISPRKYQIRKRLHSWAPNHTSQLRSRSYDGKPALSLDHWFHHGCFPVWLHWKRITRWKATSLGKSLEQTLEIGLTIQHCCFHDQSGNGWPWKHHGSCWSQKTHRRACIGPCQYNSFVLQKGKRRTENLQSVWLSLSCWKWSHFWNCWRRNHRSKRLRLRKTLKKERNDDFCLYSR